MPGRSTEKYVVTATGKLAGKTRVWVAGVFPGKKEAIPFVALLNVSRKANDLETIAAMDPHAPTNDAKDVVTDVKYAGAAIQYSPAAPGLSEDAELG